MTSPHDQSQYQVRFDWGLEGARTVASDADVVVLVDVLSAPSAPTLPDLHAAVIVGGFGNRTAVAEWVLARQAEKGDRFAVAVIASGAQRDDGTLRFAVEDLLCAGAIVDALAAVGIDYCSPEAAAACAAFTGLRGAVGHLVSASASGKELSALDPAIDFGAITSHESSSEVRVLKEYR
jgi:2-phosphosulfolactate phosphatase